MARLREVGIALPVIALLDGATAWQGVRAVRAGARSVLPRGVAADVLQRTVKATMEGQAVFPAEVAARLAAPPAGARTPAAAGRTQRRGRRRAPTARARFLEAKLGARRSA
jgi:DNA-binding NarL/FixJ family response regulator